MTTLFKVGDWVQRKEGFVDGCWLRKTKNRARDSYRVVGTKQINGFLILDNVPLSWESSLFNKVPPPELKFNVQDYL